MSRRPIASLYYEDDYAHCPTEEDGENTYHIEVSDEVGEAIPHGADGFRIELGGAVMETNQGGNMVCVTLRVGRQRLAYSQLVTDSLTDDERRVIMRRMRLALFKWVQSELRAAFENEKQNHPEVWHRLPPEQTPPAMEPPF